MRRSVASWAVVAAVGMVGACGGGEGGGAASNPGPYNLSGTLAVAESSAVDSDLNDVLQSDRSSNGDPTEAQPLETPVQLVGTVNAAGAGPAGANSDDGDHDDYFSVSLVAGQVVELEAAADIAQADVDLYLLTAPSTAGQLPTEVGASQSTTSRFECVTITTSGNYLVNVAIFRGASTYNLRIAAPGSAGSCAQRTTAANFDPTQLLAQPKAQAAVSAQSLQRSSGLTSIGQGGGPQLLQLPATATLRRQGLDTVSKTLVGASSGTRNLSSAEKEPPVITALKYAKALSASGVYDYVQPNWMMRRLVLTGTFPPSDTRYFNQRWHYELINLPAAMNRLHAAALPQTRQRPVVAVIDEGVMLDHPDIRPQLFSSGRAFVTNSTDTGDRASGDDVSQAADGATFHGTHVAGTVGASTFDSYGGAGVAPMALILPLRVFPRNTDASSLDVIQAMRYAAGLSNNSGTLPARRADVINLSLGSDRACDPGYASVVREVRAQGTVVLAASGNSALTTVGSPANCAGVIAVGAVDPSGLPASYSNTGSDLDLVAPGGATQQASDRVYSDIGTFVNGARQAGFGGLAGTSMATPHVSGVIALMRYINPSITPGQIDTLIQNGTLTSGAGSTSRNDDYGHGRIDADKAVVAAFSSVGSTVPEAPVRVVASPSTIDFGSFRSTATFNLQADAGVSESVVSVASNSAAVQVAPVANAVDGRGLGTYAITVSRTGLPDGTSFPQIVVTLSPSRTLTIPLSIRKVPAGAARVADLGPIYVLLIDPDTKDVVTAVQATHTGSSYTWSVSGYSKPSVWVIAGGDPNNDDIVCQPGEPCGDLPVISLGGDRTDLDFQVVPLSSISTQAAGTGGRGWHRTPGATP